MKDKKEIKKFGIILAILLFILALVNLLKGRPFHFQLLLFFAVAVLGCAVLSPAVLNPLFILFTLFGKAMGWLNSRVILLIVYFLILTPISLLRKLLSFSRGKAKQSSFWQRKTDSKALPSSLEKQF